MLVYVNAEVPNHRSFVILTWLLL